MQTFARGAKLITMAMRYATHVRYALQINTFDTPSASGQLPESADESPSLLGGLATRISNPLIVLHDLLAGYFCVSFARRLRL